MHALVEAANLEALKRATPAGFDWTQLTHKYAPPLTLLVKAIVHGKRSAIECAKWMISQGASPCQFADDDCDDTFTFNRKPRHSPATSRRPARECM